MPVPEFFSSVEEEASDLWPSLTGLSGTVWVSGVAAVFAAAASRPHLAFAAAALCCNFEAMAVLFLLAKCFS